VRQALERPGRVVAVVPCGRRPRPDGPQRSCPLLPRLLRAGVRLELAGKSLVSRRPRRGQRRPRRLARLEHRCRRADRSGYSRRHSCRARARSHIGGGSRATFATRLSACRTSATIKRTPLTIPFLGRDPRTRGGSSATRKQRRGGAGGSAAARAPAGFGPSRHRKERSGLSRIERRVRRTRLVGTPRRRTGGRTAHRRPSPERSDISELLTASHLRRQRWKRVRREVRTAEPVAICLVRPSCLPSGTRNRCASSRARCDPSGSCASSRRGGAFGSWACAWV
jgi:hypothetical protein